MIHYQQIEGYPDEFMLTIIWQLYQEVFETERNKEDFFENVRLFPKLFTVLAFKEEQLIGYKMGYITKPGKEFYSWIGGVRNGFRRQGIAQELMQRQHEWCKRKGLNLIRTNTQNRWKEMLILNIRNGFDIVGTFTDEKGMTRILLEKKL
jgi:GNAT superfamily N-acetyltransferase